MKQPQPSLLVSVALLFSNLVSFNLAIQSLNQNDVRRSLHVLSACHLKAEREVFSNLGRAIFGAIPSHLRSLLQCVLAISTLLGYAVRPP